MKQKKEHVDRCVNEVLAETAVVDIHTHLYDPALGDILLRGIDELVTYHYLVAELFRARPDIPYSDYWKMPKMAQADLIWRELFIKRSPLSESCRGVLTVLHMLGLNANAETLDEARGYFAGLSAREHVDKVFEVGRIRRVYMTNDPMDMQERAGWEKGFDRDARFLGVLRLDSALTNWPAPVASLKALGYDVESSLSSWTFSEVRRYLNAWCDRFEAHYMAISMPPSFLYPDEESSLTALMINAVIPVARERNIPVAMMLGVKKLANPALQVAGDSVGKSDIGTVERMARDFPDVRFLVTMLSRENMHELCVAARKFANVMPFGCWWFLNNPSLIREITAMRLELLGLSFIPQHSDSRVLDQLIYKWAHSRRIIGDVLAGKYADIAETGRTVTEDHIMRDVAMLFDGAGVSWVSVPGNVAKGKLPEK